MKANTGTMPRAAAGKRIQGVLANGSRFGFEAVTPVSPLGWAADGRQGCRWSLTDSPFDIAQYQIIGDKP